MLDEIGDLKEMKEILKAVGLDLDGMQETELRTKMLELAVTQNSGDVIKTAQRMLDFVKGKEPYVPLHEQVQ